MLCRGSTVDQRLIVFPRGREDIGHADVEHLFELFRDIPGEARPIEMTHIKKARPERRSDTGDALRQRSIGGIAENESLEAGAVFAHEASPSNSATQQSSAVSRLEVWSGGEGQ